MNKVLVITGASRGIGKAAADYFLNNGWQVINIARTSSGVKNIIDLNLDLADPAALESQKEFLLKTVGRPAQLSLVHNAALYRKDEIDKMDAVQLRSVLEVNIVAPLSLNGLLVPLMQKGSSIIYIGSTLSEKAVSHNASYVISKHASVGMMRATTQDLAERQIHSCCICPGFTETEMLVSHLNNDANLIKKLSSRVGAQRLIQPEEIASLIFYAANNPVLNGAVLHANLGQIEN